MKWCRLNSSWYYKNVDLESLNKRRVYEQGSFIMVWRGERPFLIQHVPLLIQTLLLLTIVVFVIYYYILSCYLSAIVLAFSWHAPAATGKPAQGNEKKSPKEEGNGKNRLRIFHFTLIILCSYLYTGKSGVIPTIC